MLDTELAASKGGPILHIPLVLGPFVQSGVYDLPLVHYEVKAVMTNTAPVGAYRGAGRPEAVFIVERLMDAAARRTALTMACIADGGAAS